METRTFHIEESWEKPIVLAQAQDYKSRFAYEHSFVGSLIGAMSPGELLERSSSLKPRPSWQARNKL